MEESPNTQAPHDPPVSGDMATTGIPAPKEDTNQQATESTNTETDTPVDTLQKITGSISSIEQSTEQGSLRSTEPSTVSEEPSKDPSSDPPSTQAVATTPPIATRIFNSSLGHSGPTRTKLSTLDVKLILYLITQVQPFKYVGNRSLTQNKKWEDIQERFMICKRNEAQLSQADLLISPPTIRTLQLQLAAATRKAFNSRLERRKKGIVDNIFDQVRKGAEEIDEDEEHVQRLIDQNIRFDSTTSELEAAVLKLSDLSESMKAGRVGHFAPVEEDNEESNYTQILPSIPNLLTIMSPTNAVPVQPIPTHTPQYSAYQKLPSEFPKFTQPAPHNFIAPNSITLNNPHTPFSIQNTIDKISEIEHQVQKSQKTPNPAFKEIKKLLAESFEIQKSLEHENARLIKETEDLIKKQEAYTDKVIEFNRTHQAIHERVNKNILRSVVASLLRDDTEEYKIDGLMEYRERGDNVYDDEALQAFLISLRDDIRS